VDQLEPSPCKHLLKCPAVKRLLLHDNPAPQQKASAAQAALLAAIASLDGETREIAEAVFGVGKFNGFNVTQRKAN